MSTITRIINLFGEVEAGPRLPRPSTPTPISAEAVNGPFAAVALEQSIDRMLDYAVPARLVPSLKVGQRVRVPLGKRNRPTPGYVISHPVHNRLPQGRADQERARHRGRPGSGPAQADGPGPVDEPVLRDAAGGGAGLGDPVGGQEADRASGYAQVVRLLPAREQVQAIFEKTRAPKRRAILARLLQLEPGGSIELARLAGESGATPADRPQAGAAGPDHRDAGDRPAEPDRRHSSRRRGPGPKPDIALNDDQQKVFDELLPRLCRGRPTGAPAAGFSVNLLLGVTGSGKTEVYLQCIREVVSARQAGDRAGAGDRADAADGPPVHRALQGRRHPPQRPDRHRAAPLLADDLPGPRAGRRRGALGRVRAAAGPGDHRRR